MNYAHSYASDSMGDFITYDPRIWGINAGKISNSKLAWGVCSEILSPTISKWGEGTGFRNTEILDVNKEYILL